MAPRPLECDESRAGGRSEPLTVVLQWDRGQRRVPTRKAGYGVAAAHDAEAIVNGLRSKQIKARKAWRRAAKRGGPYKVVR